MSAHRPLAAHRPGAAVAVILVAALLLLMPEFVAGLTHSDSSIYTLVWSDQVSAAVRRGTLYPRWLPASWHGLGSPTFYFYPPLFFWVEALVTIVTAGLLPGTMAISATSAIMLAISGLAMRGWLRGLASDLIALIGALVYMAAPYHLRDLYMRGAVAEASAYAMLPLVMLALRRVADRSGGVAPLALAYAGLILTHLPSALLASVSILPVYAASRAATSAAPARRLAAMAGGAALGIALAGVYLVPALGLTRAISTALGDRDFYASTTNVMLNAGHWLAPPLRVWSIGLILAATVLAALSAAVAEHRRAGTRATWIWTGLTIAVAALVIGLVPGVWRLPGLAQVQFPWRMLLIGEFAAITAVATGRPRPTAPAMIVALAALAMIWTIELSSIRGLVSRTRATSAAETAALRRTNPDAPEYLPPSFNFALAPGMPADAETVPLPHPPIAAAPGARVAARPMPDGGLDLMVAATGPTRLTVARFRFPAWRLTQDGAEIAIAPEPHSPLVSWPVPAGTHRYRLRIGLTPQERAGWSITILAAMLTMALAIRRRSGLPRSRADV